MAINTLSVGSVYLIAVLYIPTEAERIGGAKKTVLVAPQFVLADDAQAASNKAIMLAAVAGQGSTAPDPDRCEVLVTKPF
jgi:hypothetical protein